MIKRVGTINALWHFAIWLAALFLLAKVGAGNLKLSWGGLFYVDALSALLILTTATVTFAAALFSLSYIAADLAQGKISPAKALWYYLLFNLFAGAMFLVPLINNLGFLWMAIELTTLISSFLVGFYNTKHSVEAAWKYLIICSVGITLALFGAILFTYALQSATGLKSLNWTVLLASAGQLNPNLVKAAFIFILVGYGTKAGLAPLHTWLPDAHSQAISPVSAMLSGVLLKCSLYAILRYGIVVTACCGAPFYSRLMLFFGLFSLAVACIFIITQKDLKRLLAYSSIEHLGLIAVGIGLNSPLALFGALLHLFNHAVSKALMFFGAGRIAQAYGTHDLSKISGVTRALPVTGTALLIGSCALIGFPPGAIFISEFYLVSAAFVGGHYLIGGLLLGWLAVIGGALLYHFGKVLFGKPLTQPVSPAEPIGSWLSYGFLLIFIIGLGIFIPNVLRQSLNAAVGVLRGS
ncbi:MAG: hydrogenase 4 subunit F [Candidatus Margulisbacteria bacterium]|jgi:hydrogenase-4 component F|nr:hydrogenase 4 subunit F [Candidatus Margulisiibacteriota bacterium]